VIWGFFKDKGKIMNVQITIDSETLAEILAEMKSGAARLRGQRIEFCDKRMAAALERCMGELQEAAEQGVEHE
jgi:hypothetical protein